jgi:hypothetical protein
MHSERRWRELSNSLFVDLLAFLGGFVILLALYPRLTVTISGPSDNLQVLSSSFMVSNYGLLPARSVSTTCMLGEVALRSNFSGGGSLVPMVSPGIPESLTLYPGAKESIPFRNCFAFSSEILTGAHFGLRVTYRPSFWPQTRTVTQEFYASNTGNGQVVWHRYPIN